MKTKTLFSGISAIVIASLVLFGVAPWVSAKSGPGKNGNKVEDNSRGRNSSQVLGFNLEREMKANLIFNSVSGSVTGTAKIKAERKSSSLIETKIDIDVRRTVTSTSNTVFEGWLVDNQTGFKLSLGGLSPNVQSNRFKLHFEGNLVNPSVYESLIVTEEPMNDTNPNPGATVLSANIPASSLADVALKAKLRGSLEVPSTTSTAMGEGRFLVNTASNTLMFEVKIKNLNGVETAAHIHGPATTTQNAGVLFTLPTGTVKIGTWTYAESQENDIISGRTYVNVHSDKFPNGEIRGQIVVK